MDNKERLYEAFNSFLKIKGECSCKVIDELNMSELTLKQIEYLKRIGKHERITSSEIAKVFDLSKPSVTEMVKKFMKLDCVYKKQCSQDGRVQYIELTEKGQCIAKADEMTMERLVERVENSLSEEEIDALIMLIDKIE